MVDSKKEHSEKIDVSLEQGEEGYTLTLKPDNEWLNDSQRVYPVTIDPPVRTSLDVNSIHDTFVASNLPNENKYESIILGVGKASVSGTTRTFIKFDLPALNVSDMIINATLALALYTDNSTTRQINVHRVNSNWDSSTITWNNAPGYNSKIEDYCMVHGNAGDWSSWDVTSIVKDWYKTGNNYGLMLKNQDESVGYNEFLASDCSSGYANLRPQIILTYVNNSGLESYWSYHGQSVGRAGTGYVNDYNGNVVFVHEDLAMSGNRIPVAINHVFNSNDKASSMGYGNGWRLNLSQRVTPKTFDGKQYYEYIDEDGTKHYFYYDSAAAIYKDESGVDLTLTIDADGTFTIKDKKDNQLIFTSAGYLLKIQDNNGNAQLLSYQGTTLKSITDGAGRTTTLNILENGYLIGIKDPSGRETSFSYTGTKLSKITYPDGKYSLYNYDANNNLLNVTNFDGYKLVYTYYSQAPYRVNTVLETHTDGTLGDQLTMTYGYNTTTFTDTKNKKNVYQFNDNGNTVSVKDDDGSAMYYKFDTGSNVNKLSLESKLQKTVVNYLKNHNAEITDSGWTVSSGNSSTGVSTFTTEDKYIGSQSLKIQKTNNLGYHVHNQQLTLQKGKTYVLSAYIKTNNISNTNGKGASIFINYQDSSGAWKSVSSAYINGTKDSERYEVKFTMPADALNNYAYVRIGVTEETGTAYFDCLQFEDGAIPNRYNMVENSDFNFDTGTPIYWSKNAACDSNDTQANIEGRNTFRFNGAATLQKNIYQTIKVSGNKGDSFILSGWAKGDSIPVPSGSGRYFALDLGIKRSNGTYQYAVVAFNQDTSDWQYASDVIIADSDYTEVNVYAIYYNNANTAYFDNIQLYKEEFGTSYTYDSKGNVISTKDLAKQNSTFTYNTSNDLVTATDPKGNNFNYVNDAKHNLTTATSAENVVYSFTYDSYGNPLTSKVGDSSTFTLSKASYTSNGNYLKSLTDSRGNAIVSNWDETKGILNSKVDTKGNFTNYQYDNLDRLTSVSKSLGVKNLELFELNGTTLGTKGTKAAADNAVYEKDVYDENNKAYMANYASTENLLPTNSSFESGITGWTLTDWSSLTGAWRSVEDGINGSKALECYDSDGLTNGSITNAVAYQYVTLSSALTAPAAYTLSTYVKRTGDTEPQLGINCYDINGNQVSGGYQNYTQTIPLNQWVRVSQTFTVPAGTKKFMAILRSNVKDGETIRFDGAQVEAKAYSSPYTASTSSSTKVTYNLGVNKNSGTMSLWMNTKGTGSRQVFANEATNQELLNVYVDSQDKLKVAVNKPDVGFYNILTADDAVINKNQWYFVALKWETNGEELNCTLYLNDKAYSAVVSVAEFKDFSGGITGVGNSINGTSSFNGSIKEFYYTPKALSAEDITSLYNNTLVDNPDSTVTNSYAYENDRIKTITHNGFNYSFGYDSLGNNTTVSAGNQNLITNIYEARTSKLLESIYGNGQRVSSDYDSLDRVTAKKFNGNIRYTYQYDNAGNLGYHEDLVNGVNYRYVYDTADRLVKTFDNQGNSTTFGYDANNNQNKVTEKIGASTYETNYAYDSDNKPTTVTYNRGTNSTLTFDYDTILGRLLTKKINTGTAEFTTYYSYLNGSNGSKTNLVGSITNGNSAPITYTYDANGNIETITYDKDTDDEKKIYYAYNELNELIREDNEVLDKTITYSYDVGGNILKREEFEYTRGIPQTLVKPYEYKYEDTNWKDKLTSFAGNPITYDAIGNPLSDGSYTYTWENGRQLKSVTNEDLNISFKYNDAGIRTEKTVNGVTTKYYLLGDKVTFETDGENSIYYTYDSSDNLVSMNLNGVEYYYVRNAQNDIIGLFDSTGTQVVSYIYDTWGKLISIDGSLKDTVGVKNPYRYRGYRYDTENGLYYLQSRYYNSEWSRFINADDVEVTEILKDELLGINLFTYCMNDPINETDSTGFFIDTIFDIISIGISISKVMANPRMAGNWVALGADIISAALPGVTGGGSLVRAGIKSGRAGKQAKLRKIANNPKVSRALRGEIKRDINLIKKGKRKTIRVPKGYELAHKRGLEARKGYGYEHSDLQIIKNHRTQHKYDKYGRGR